MNKKKLIQKAIVRAGFSNAKVSELKPLNLTIVMYHLIDVTEEQLAIGSKNDSVESKKDKEFFKGTRFELNSIVYIVTEIDHYWIHCEREDGKKPTLADDTMAFLAFMPNSNNWEKAKILN